MFSKVGVFSVLTTMPLWHDARSVMHKVAKRIFFMKNLRIRDFWIRDCFLFFLDNLDNLDFLELVA